MSWWCFRRPARGEDTPIASPSIVKVPEQPEPGSVLAIGHVRARIFHWMNLDEILLYWGRSEVRDIEEDTERVRDLLYQLTDDTSSAFQQFAALPRGGDADARRFVEIAQLNADGVRFRMAGDPGQPVVLRDHGLCRHTLVASLIFGIFECPVEESEREKCLMAAFLYWLDRGEIPMNMSFVHRFCHEEHDHKMTPMGYLLFYVQHVLHRARRARLWAFVCAVLERVPLPSLYLPGYQGVYGLLNCTTGEALSNAFLCHRLFPHEVADCVRTGKMDLALAGDESGTVRVALERRYRKDQEWLLHLGEIESSYLAIAAELGELRQAQRERPQAERYESWRPLPPPLLPHVSAPP